MKLHRLNNRIDRPAAGDTCPASDNTVFPAGDFGGFLVIFLCFFLTSAGYLAWLYHLIDLKPAADVDLLTEVLGYLFQAVGVGLVSFCAYKKPEVVTRSGFLCSNILFVIFLLPAIFLTNAAAVILCGFVMNALCGCIAGYYLLDLSENVSANRRATVFSFGYGTATFAMWLLSRVSVFSGLWQMMVPALCILAVAVMILYLHFSGWELAVPSAAGETLGERSASAGSASAGTSASAGSVSAGTNASARTGFSAAARSFGRLVLTACLTLLLLSMVKNLGFSFPATHLVQGISLESTRLFYGAGLIISGLVCDRSRKYGALCCLISLAIPFVMLTLTGEPVSATALWCLNYFTYGFISVFRVILFSDIADAGGLLPISVPDRFPDSADAGRLLSISVLGLFSGRIGDALGTAVYLLCDDRRSILIVITALLFMLTMFLFFHLYQRIYMPEQGAQQSEEERFFAFAVRHDLSAREQDVLRRIILGNSNSEIAAELFVAESTVKYHVHNILQKTGCRNRNELMVMYRTS